MLKAIKIPEEAYKDAKRLSKRLEKDKIIEGLYKVKLSTAVSYAIRKALEDIKRKKAFNDIEGVKIKAI